MNAEIEFELQWDHICGAQIEAAKVEEDESYCQCCGKDTPKAELTYVGHGWDYMGCADCVAHAHAQLAAEKAELAELETMEPECTCAQTDVDLFDSCGCELHDSRSPWNALRRSLTMTARYEQALPEVA